MISDGDKQEQTHTKLPTVHNSWFTQHTSSVDIMYKKKQTKTLLCISITRLVWVSVSVSLWSVTQMKLTKTGSGWGVRRGRQTGSSWFTDVDLRVNKRAYFGSNYPENSLLEVLGNCQSLPHWETNSSYLEARLQQQSGSWISILQLRSPKADNTHINNS